jgi:hypothetical protein
MVFSATCIRVSFTLHEECVGNTLMINNFTPTSTYKGLKKEYHSTNNVENEFWLCLDGIKHCVNNNMIGM